MEPRMFATNTARKADTSQTLSSVQSRTPESHAVPHDYHQTPGIVLLTLPPSRESNSKTPTGRSTQDCFFVYLYSPEYKHPQVYLLQKARHARLCGILQGYLCFGYRTTSKDTTLVRVSIGYSWLSSSVALL